MPLIIFALLCGGGLFLVDLMEQTTFSIPVILQSLPYGLALIGIVLSVVFHQTALVYSFVILAGGFYFTQITATAGPNETVLGQVGFAALVLLLPLNILMASFFKPVSIISPRSISRVALFVIQVAIVTTLVASPDWQDIGRHLHIRFMHHDYDHWTWLTQPALLAIIICVIIASIRMFVSGLPLHVAAWGAIILSSMALHFADNTSAVIIFFSLALLNYIIALVHDTYRMAFLDELTGLPGRRALMNLFSVLGPRYVIAMCDIDHFKKFNDTYGHDVGDQVLKMVATVLGEVKGGGRAYRYGGEEFTIVFPRRTIDYAKPYLEQVRQAVETSAFALRDKERPKNRPENPSKASGQKTVQVAISIGIADKSSHDGKPMDILKHADKALYRAKKAGRNCLSE